MNAAFTHRDFLRMMHLCVSSPRFGQFPNKVSLTFELAHRCLTI